MGSCQGVERLVARPKVLKPYPVTHARRSMPSDSHHTSVRPVESAALDLNRVSSRSTPNHATAISPSATANSHGGTPRWRLRPMPASTRPITKARIPPREVLATRAEMPASAGTAASISAAPSGLASATSRRLELGRAPTRHS